MPEVDRQRLEKQTRIALRNCGIINPEHIDEYIEKGGYKATEKCVKELTPEEAIEKIDELVKKDDVVLVKASRGMELERIVEYLNK